MPVSLTDVAKAAGVSIATVSRVLNRTDYPVAMETREKVLCAARELRYQPNLIARSLRVERTHTIGIIVENLLSPFIPRMVRGIQKCLNENDYLSITLSADWDPVVEVNAVERLRRRQIDGLIFVESYLRTAEEVAPLIDKPFVFVHRLINSQGINSIVPDDHYGARLAVNHLIKLGHRRIAFIGGPPRWDAAADRLAGYREELAAHEIKFDPDLITSGDWQVQSGHRAARQLLSGAQRPTAVFAANDLMALGAIYAFQEAGLTVPDDIAVVGYDDRDFAGFVRPLLTTVQMPCEQMGSLAAEALLRLISGEAKQIEPTMARGHLVVRQSCGARHKDWTFEPEEASFTRRYTPHPPSTDP